MIGPLTVEPSNFTPPLSAMNTRSSSPPDDPPPMDVIKSKILNRCIFSQKCHLSLYNLLCDISS
jgi:hypothetical protein